MTFADELRSRLKSKQREWEKCKEEVRKAKEKESHVRDELSALQVLVNAEHPKKATDKPLSVPLPIAEKVEVNKAETIRMLIHEHSTTGLTPSQLRTLLADRHIELNGPYIYSVLLRAKRAGKIMERNRRYFPAVEKENAAS